NLGGLSTTDLQSRFIAVATELATGHEVWLSHGSLVEALNASYALPGVVAPVAIDGRWRVGGALVNPVPVSVCRAHGARLVIAVNLNADIIGRARSGSAARTENGGAGLLAELEQVGPPGGPVRGVLRQFLRHDDGPSLFSVMV